MEKQTPTKKKKERKNESFERKRRRRPSMMIFFSVFIVRPFVFIRRIGEII